MITLFKIALVLLALMGLFAHFLRTLGDVVMLGVILFYGFVGSFVIGGLAILVVMTARWWVRVPWSTRRACWMISVVSWAIYTLCPDAHRKDMAEWMREVALSILRRYQPAYDVRFVCMYPSTCASPKPYTAERTERVQSTSVTCPGEAEVYVRSYWNVIRILAIDPVPTMRQTPRRRSFWS